MQFTHKAGLALASLTLLGLAASSPAQAGNPVYVESGNSQFGVLNPTTGAYTLIGTFSSNIGIGGLCFGAKGNLYGVGYNFTNKSIGLYQINTANAALSVVGNLGFSPQVGYGIGTTSDGALYAYSGNTFYQINPTTSAAMPVGSLGVIADGAFNGDDSGHLYLTGGSKNQGFYEVDRITGQATLIGTSSYGTVFSLADTGGTLYAINDSGSIFSVNTATGESTLTATYDTAADGVVNAAAAQFSPIPEASTTVSFGLLLCLGLAGWLGVCAARRRRRANKNARQ